MAERVKVKVNDGQEKVSIFVQSGYQQIPTKTSQLINDGSDGTNPFISNTIIQNFTDIASLLAGQGAQIEDGVYGVIDASADSALTFPSGETRLQAYYRYLGTTTGTMADYELISAPWREVAPVMIIKTANYTLAANENGATIVNPGYICTFDPTTVTYPNGYIVAMDNDTDATAVSIVLIGLTGWSYKLNDGAWTALTTGSNVTLSWPAGATCTLYRKGNEQKIRINGGVE
jgi:hypothetical protein